MKNRKFLTITLAMLLCVAMVLPMFIFNTGAEPVNFDEANIGTGFKGKKISILGDSISTYEGVSNDSANSNISGNVVYYTENNTYGVTREDTWWQQAIDKLQLELCVNNSWSGSSVMGTDSTDNYTAAWANRCVQLHTASANPDIIAVYMGTNDIKNMTTGFSTFANNKDTMLSEAAGTSTSVKKFSLYIRMVNKMLTQYPSAQIYLFTLLPNESQNDVQIRAMEQYNQSIRDLVTYYQGQSKKVYLVDLYNDTSITRDFEILKKHLANTLHPNDLGMDAITNCFLSSLVHNSKLATSPDNWRKVVYDLTDVYVRGGQINTIRASNSGNYPFSVSLVPTRSEYDLEVKVERRVGSNSWKDITAQCYSGGTVFIRNLPRNNYAEGLRITAKAVYNPKNFRWEMGDSGLVSCVMDGTDYGISGTLTSNDLTLENGSYTDGSFADTQYQLSDTILLRNEEPWVLEWKAKGVHSKSMMLFSEGENAGSRSNVYVYFNGGSKLFIGYRNGYRSAYWNYGVDLTGVTFGEDTSHTFRLANQINSDGTNMVYLYVDDVNMGAMKNYHIASEAQTGDELAEETWLSGRDLEFSFLGAGTSFYLNQCSIEYIQVWEGGGYDTLRLQQLIDEYNHELSTTMANATNFAAYESAVQAAQTYMNNTANADRTQQDYDDHVTAIVTARNNLTKSADATEIISVELLSRNYVPIGKQTGLKIVTTPDVQKIQVGNSARTLLTHTSSIQTMTINGEEREVKVWLVSWMRKETTQRVVQYRIHALKDANATASSDSYGDASVTFEVPYGANCLAYIEVTKKPDKLYYLEGEKFDKTGMEVTAYYGDGSKSKVVSDFVVKDASAALTAGTKSVTIRYKDANYGDSYVNVDLPIEVMVEVSRLKDFEPGTNLVLHGYYVGVAQEGMSGDNEILIKDVNTDEIIAIRNVKGDFPNFGYRYGDEVKIIGTYMLDGTTNTPNKHYFAFSEWNFTVNDTILSRDNQVTYKFDNVVEISSWEQMQSLIKVGTINEYTYLKFTGDFYLREYVGTSDPTVVYKVHMNASATDTASTMKPDGTRTVTLRTNVMEKNLGSNWLDLFELTGSLTAKPGAKSENDMIALYTGANGTYYQLTILRSDWINIK